MKTFLSLLLFVMTLVLLVTHFLKLFNQNDPLIHLTFFSYFSPWVGNCVGKRNYRYFYLFLLSLAVHCVFIFACAVTHLVLLTKNDHNGNDGPFIEAIQASPTSIIVCVICFFSVWSILGLAGFHT